MGYILEDDNGPVGAEVRQESIVFSFDTEKPDQYERIEIYISQLPALKEMVERAIKYVLEKRYSKLPPAPEAKPE